MKPAKYYHIIFSVCMRTLKTVML